MLNIARPACLTSLLLPLALAGCAGPPEQLPAQARIRIDTASPEAGLIGEIELGDTRLRFAARNQPDSGIEAIIVDESGVVLADLRYPIAGQDTVELAGRDLRALTADDEAALRELAASPAGAAIRRLALDLVDAHSDPLLVHERWMIESVYMLLEGYYDEPLTAQALGSSSCRRDTGDYSASCEGGFEISGVHPDGARHRDPGNCLGACGKKCGNCTYASEYASAGNCVGNEDGGSMPGTGTRTCTCKHIDKCKEHPSCLAHDNCCRTKTGGCLHPTCMALFIKPIISYFKDQWTPKEFSHTMQSPDKVSCTVGVDDEATKASQCASVCTAAKTIDDKKPSQLFADARPPLAPPPSPAGDAGPGGDAGADCTGSTPPHTGCKQQGNGDQKCCDKDDKGCWSCCTFPKDGSSYGAPTCSGCINNKTKDGTGGVSNE